MKEIAELQQDYADLQKQIGATQKTIDELQERLNQDNSEYKTLEKIREQTALRLEYLRRKAAVREKYIAAPVSNDVRQKELTFQGIRPKKMDVVHFHVPQVGDKEEMDGVALVKDENHYYFAVDMYDHPDREDNTTTIMDENPDGTFEGIWPKHVCLKAASKFEERYVRNLTEKYADDLDKAENMIAALVASEKGEVETLEPKLKELNERLSDRDADNKKLAEAQGVLELLNAECKKVEDELKKQKDSTEDSETDGLKFDLQESEYEPVKGLELDTDMEKKYPHLPYLRGKRKMTTMNWPAINPEELEPWLRYRLMGNVARLVEKTRECRAITYVLSEDYFTELGNRGRLHYKGMLPQDVVGEGEVSGGVIVYPSQGFDDTIIYYINRRGMLSIQVAYLRETRLMFYESYSVQEIIGSPRTDIYICKSLREAGTEANRLFAWIRNLVVSFLAMEHDMERTVNHLIEEGAGCAIESTIDKEKNLDVIADMDVAIRDASWYTDITVNRKIPVRGYISHRLCGTGKEKYVKEVWVRPYIKKGYHRTATVKVEKLKS